MNQTIYTYWLRSSVGLEQFAAHEFQDKCEGIIESTSHRTVIAESGLDRSHIGAKLLKYTDDVYSNYLQVKGIDHTRASINQLVGYLSENLLPTLQKITPADVRTSVSFLGKRNYNRYFVEQQVNDMLSQHLSAKFLSNEAGDKWIADECRIRIHVEDQIAHMGIALGDKPLHRRTWRTVSYDGQLHPPLAAVLASHVPEVTHPIVDPFSGSGTLLIETDALLKSPLYGYDINPEAVRISRVNAATSQREVAFVEGEFLDYADALDGFTILTNPPWGKKFNSKNDSDISMLALLKSIIEKAEYSIILMPYVFEEWLESHQMKFEVILSTRVKGQLVKGYKIQ